MSAENGIKTFEKSEDLKEIEEEYNSCLTLKNNGNMRSPSLKYAYYNLNLKRLFMKKIKIIQINIDKIQKSMLNNKEKCTDNIEETVLLNDIKMKLISFENEAREKYDFNNDYLINLAKRVDKLKNPIADSVYVKASEEIIKSVIKYYVKCEKNFLLFNDNIKNLKQKFFI